MEDVFRISLILKFPGHLLQPVRQGLMNERLLFFQKRKRKTPKKNNLSSVSNGISDQEEAKSDVTKAVWLVIHYIIHFFASSV